MSNSTYERVGLIAGRGRYPLLTAESARKHGVKYLSVVGIRGDADSSLERYADQLTWLYPGQLDSAIKTFKEAQIEHVILAGQIKPERLFTGIRPDFRTLKLLAMLKLKNAGSIFSAVAAEFEKDQITILPATTFLGEHLADDGVMGKIKLKEKHLADVAYGKRICNEIARLDIGQSVVVKDGTVLAVEGFEGTDEAIIRGGKLGRGRVIVVKLAKPQQDTRFDVPCIGIRTVDSLITARAAALVVQARKTLLLDKELVIEALNDAKIAIAGVTLEDCARSNS